MVRDSSEAEMVAVFLSGELSSERFGPAIRDALLACGQSERLLVEPDLNDTRANGARRAVLAATRGYGEDRELFEHFPAQVRWEWIRLTARELARVRYVEYSYWNELSGGSRLAAMLLTASVWAFDLGVSPTSGFTRPPERCAAENGFRPSSWPGLTATISSAWRGTSG